MRRIFAFIVLFIAFSVSAAAETFAVNTKNGCEVIDSDGSRRFSCSSFNIIFPLKNENGATTGYAAGIRTSDETIFYALLSPNGSKLTRHIYTYIEAAGAGFIAAVRDKWYCLNSRGAVVGSGYSDMEYLGGSAYAVKGDPYDEIADDLLLLYPGGREVHTGIEIQYGLGNYSEDLMPLTSGKNLLAGYVDANAQWVIEPSFTYAGEFSNGLAIAAKKTGYGVIDASGEEIIPFEHTFLSRSGDKFCAIKDNIVCIFDSDGSVLSETALNGASAQFSDGRLILTSPDETRIQDATGNLLFTLAPDLTAEVCENLFIVRSAEYAYVADADGLALSSQYDFLDHLDGSVFVCGTRGEDGDVQYGLLRAPDGEITDCRYDSISLLQPGLYAISSGSALFIMEQSGYTIPVR